MPPLVTAGVLLAARSLSEPHGVPQPSVGEILRLTGATRSRAYEIKDALQAVLPTLARPPGRPRVESAPGPANAPELVGIAVEMIQFLKQSPGCVQSGARDHYADCFRRFVIELRERHAEVAAAEFAAAIDLPLGTLEDWMRCVRPVTVAADAFAAEDSAAVTEAFTQGAQTTGGQPLACLLDNRPSNHTPEVDAALGDTMRIRATPGRAQNKAHAEGAFGLFAPRVPAIVLDTRDPHALAITVAQLVATTFFRAFNRAPRRDRAGKTRVDLYEQPVTPKQYQAASAALRERMRKQELVSQTRDARRDPVIAALLDDAFARLGLLDPERHVRDAIACYPRDAIVDAIAIFSGKRTAGTPPDGVDARYLLGIVRNLHRCHEAVPITEALIRERLSARDRFLAPLISERDAILATGGTDVGAMLIAPR